MNFPLVGVLCKSQIKVVIKEDCQKINFSMCTFKVTHHCITGH